ncbi:MAG: ATP-binding cassette domain-containing protein [candidate division WOR-3 bacterium]|jgi:heme exporter protein A
MKLIARKISKKINNKIIFEDISFEIEKGILLIKGKNGSGKTTLLKILAQFEKQTSGEIIYDDIKKFEISYLGHKLGIYLELKVEENLRLFPVNEQFLKIFEIEKFLNYKTKNLSRGNLQKLAIIRALSKPGKLYLLDEPTVSLDEFSKEKFFSLIERLSKEKIIVITSHEFIPFHHQLLSLDQ